MRPCPRGLEHTCPIPRELCVEEHHRTGSWNCEKLLDEFEWFLFGDEEETEGSREEIRGNDKSEGFFYIAPLRAIKPKGERGS